MRDWERSSMEDARHSRRKTFWTDVVTLVIAAVLLLLAWLPYAYLLLIGGGVILMIASKIRNLIKRPHFEKWVACEAVAADYYAEKDGLSIQREQMYRYAPVMVYETTDGRKVRAAFPVSKADKQYTLGKSYHIRYNPRDPEEFCFNGREDEYLIRCQDHSGGCLGIVCIVVGIGCMVFQTANAAQGG